MRRPWRALLATFLIAGCNSAGEVPAERLPRFTPAGGTAPRVALVLGSGGPRGFAHIGVLKVLEEAGVRPDLIIGSSVGAMVGALYAAGKSAAELETLARDLNVMEFFEFRMLSGGLATGETLQAYMNERVGGKPLEALGIAFVAGATRVSDRSLALFNRGDTGLAIRASSASPGQFEPVRIGSEFYVDGDEASPVPIRAARALGAQFVIAVDVSAFERDTPAGAPREWVEKDARRARQVAREASAADVLLHPNIGYYAGHDAAYRRRVIDLGERYAREQLPAIRAAFARAGIPLLRAQTASTARIPAGEASR
ncbi:MAG: patatin-like phospholipase family protein [Pseudomonadota bacterium]|nr:patatin-like phospholipase family protein [Pseudomonadota bacterium]